MVVVRGPRGDTGQGLGESIQTLVEIFYANDGLVASPASARLQGAFNFLKVLFYRVVLRTNKGNIVSMPCRPCHIPHVLSMEAYTW